MTIKDLTKEQLEEYVKSSTNWKELMIKCGYNNLNTRINLKRKLVLYNLTTTHFTVNKVTKKYTLDEIFVENSKYTSTDTMKKRLFDTYNFKRECSECKLTQWLDKGGINLELDHINGNHTDNRIENLRFLCPNCHSYTDTYRGKNVKHPEKVYDKLKCSCGNKKYKNSVHCVECNNKLKNRVINSNKDDIYHHYTKENKCLDCNKVIQNESSRCKECFIKARNENRPTDEKTHTNKKHKCMDCDKLIFKKSMRCRKCDYKFLSISVQNIPENKVKGVCPDCNKNIDKRAIRCIDCTKALKEQINSKRKKNCIDCNAPIFSNDTRCQECYQKSTRKVERPSYEQLCEDKKTMSILKISEKYGVSDSAVRKWIKKYEKSLNIQSD